MTDTIRTKSALQALLANNTTGDISPQDVRDFLVSVLGTEYVTVVNTATYNVVDNDVVLHVTRTATGTCAITLPTALATDHRKIEIKDAGGGAETYNITVDTEGSEKIDGTDTLTISGNYEAITLYCISSNWFVR